jgi:putative spermidine/putrescine transport system substrate-binding protein
MSSINRRAFLKILGASCAGAILESEPFGKNLSLAEENILVVSEWGGSFQDALREAFFEPFTKETGIKIIEQTWGNQALAKLKAQEDANKVEVDLVGGPPLWAFIGKDQGIVDKIDTKFIDKSNVMKTSMMEYGFGYSLASWGLTFNTKTFSKKAPKSWSDFWDVKSFPGGRTMFGSALFRHPEYALFADGVPLKEVYPLDPNKIDRAFKKLDEIKPNITTWYTAGGQCQQLLADQEVVLAEFFNGRTFDLGKEGVPVKFEFNEAVYNQTTWVLAKSAPHKESALKFLGFISQAKPQARLAEITTYGPVNKKALDLIKDDTIIKNLPSHPDNIGKQIELDSEWWAKNMAAYSSRWNTWVSSK